MKKSTFCLLVLPALLFITSLPTFAQKFKPGAAKKAFAERLREIARAKGSTQPFTILTPKDLEIFSEQEKNSLFAADPCDTATQINFGQTVNGALSNTDCRLDDGTYADFYTFNATQGQGVEIRLNSTAFDAYLGLANQSGTFVVEDDDGGGGTNSRILVTLPQTGLYIILANSVFPNEVGNYTLTLTEVINCTYSISPTSANIPVTGGTFSFTITTQNGCRWTARTNNEDFVTVNTASGTGPSQISYTVAQNGSGQARGGSIIVNDSISFTLQQPTLQCNFVLTPSTANFPVAGGSGTVNVAVQAGCEWRVFSNSSFITASGSGTGNGSFNYTVASNPGADRSGSITVGRSAPVFYYINQAGFNCTTTVSAQEIVAGKTGKTGTIFVNSNCAWTVSVNNPFLQVTNGAGNGSGSFTYRVLANDTGSIRSGSLRVNDGQNSYTVFIDQRGTIYNSKFDFTRDGKADYAVYRPASGLWLVNITGTDVRQTQFGTATDKIVPADYDGDGFADIAVYRPSNGFWYFNNVSGLSAVQFGANGDVPVPADYDGDGFADIAVYRPSNGYWYIRPSSYEGFVAVQFGIAEDIPTLGDFDGDGKADIAVYRPSTGDWYRLNSSNNSFVAVKFGLPTDKPVAADYDGDGKTDIAVYRPNGGFWYRLNSSDGAFSSTQFGAGDDIPVAADYDGDKKTDIAVFRPSERNWYILKSTGGFSGFQYGAAGDLPIQSAFTR